MTVVQNMEANRARGAPCRQTLVMKTPQKGVFKGEDAGGNKYFEDMTLPSGAPGAKVGPRWQCTPKACSCRMHLLQLPRGSLVALPLVLQPLPCFRHKLPMQVMLQLGHLAALR